QFSGRSLSVKGVTQPATIEANQIWYLTQPAGAFRFDYVDGFVKSQFYDPTTHVLTITPESGKGQAFSGSPVQVSTDGTFDFTDSEKCLNQADKTKTQNDDENYHATWTDGQHLLTVHMAIGGTVQVPSQAGHAGL